MKRKSVYDRAQAAAYRAVPRDAHPLARGSARDYFAVGYMRGYEAARRERGKP